MGQEDIERRLREIFGEGAGRTAHTQGTKEIDNPAFVPPGSPGFNPTIPPKLTVTEETWKDASNNALTIQRWPDGTVHEIGATTAPSAGRASPDESVSAPPTQPYITTRKPDGSIQQTPNPNYNPNTGAAAASEARNTQELDRERQWNSDHGYGWVTHAQRAEQVNQQQAQARADNNAARQAAAQEAANQLARDRLQFDKDKANLPDVKVESKPVNGTAYTQVTRTTPQGAVTISYYGPDGKPVAALPSEGAASAGGPSMAQYVKDGSIQGLTALHTALWNDPTLTPEQREKRFQEGVQVANLAVQQAATEQRERESTRNAEYNTAATKLTHMQTGLSQALDFVSKINGNLPVGSDLGAKAFAALMGLSVLQMQASGINSLPGLSAPKVPTITAADLNNPAKLDEHNQAVSQAAAAAASPPPPAAQNAGAGSGEPPARGAIPPAAPAVPAAPAPSPAAPAAPAPSLPPGRPDQTQVGAQIDNAISPPQSDNPEVTVRSKATGETTRMTVGAFNALPNAADYEVVDPNGAGSVSPATATPDSAPLFEPGPHPLPPPDYGQPGMTVLPPLSLPGTPPFQQPGTTAAPDNPQDIPFNPPESPTPGLPVGRTPTDWPILGRYMQQPAAAAAPQPSDQQQPQPAEEMPALRAARIAATPPWRLAPEDFSWAEANGLLDKAMSVPGRSVA